MQLVNFKNMSYTMNSLVNKYIWLSMHEMWFSAFFFPSGIKT